MNIYLNKILPIILIFSFFCQAACLAQPLRSYKHKALHKTRIEPGSKLIECRIHYSFEKTKYGNYIYKHYYPERNVRTEWITFKDSKRQIKDGPYQMWSEYGSLTESGNFENGVKVGLSKFYGKDTTVFAEEKYLNGDEYERTNFDSLGRKESRYHFKNYKKEGYKDYKKEGPFEIYDEEGEIARKGIYKDGQLVSVENLKPLSNIEDYDSLEPKIQVMPLWKSEECDSIADIALRAECGNRKMLEFIFRRINYPLYCMEEDIQGTAIIRFIITEDGSLEDIQVVRGISDDIARECTRVVKLMPKFHPGTQNGEPVKVYFNLPIKFKLE